MAMSSQEKASMPATTTTTTTIGTEMSMMEPAAEDKNLNKTYNKKTKAKATKIICENDKQHHPEQQLQYNRQQLDYNYYEFKKKHGIPRVQNENNDDDYDNDNANANNDTITIDNTATTIKDPNTTLTTTSKRISNTGMMISSVKTSNPRMLVNGCGNIGANCSNCRNIKILLRLSLRYFYDINCEFVKNII